MTKRRVIEIFYFNAGGGHSSAMQALKDVIAEQYPEWSVNPVNLQDLLQSLDPVHKTTQIVSKSLRKFKPDTPFKVTQAQDFYNALLKKGSTRGMSMGLRMTQLFIKSQAPRMEEILRQYWQDKKTERPDLVVSVIPNFNRPLFNALKAAYFDVPYVTIMTDMVDYPPHFWMENQDQFLICGTEKAAEQARATKFYRSGKILKVSGMILRKSFYSVPENPRITHEDLGLSPDRPTALVMFGGNGSSVSEDIVDQLEKAVGIQTIVMCGRNAELFKSLQDRPNCCAVGFVTNVADYIRLADIFIGKPGPGSISEALHMECPVIVECNRSTMPQERPNVNWILENGAGIAIKNFKTGVVGAVQHMIGHLEFYRDNIRLNIPKNRAVYEIPTLLNQIMDTHSASVPSAPSRKRQLLPRPLGRRVVRSLRRRFK